MSYITARPDYDMPWLLDNEYTPVGLVKPSGDITYLPRIVNGALLGADGSTVVPPIVVSADAPNNDDGRPDGTIYFYVGA